MEQNDELLEKIKTLQTESHEHENRADEFERELKSLQLKYSQLEGICNFHYLSTLDYSISSSIK